MVALRVISGCIIAFTVAEAGEVQSVLPVNRVGLTLNIEGIKSDFFQLMEQSDDLSVNYKYLGRKFSRIIH